MIIWSNISPHTKYRILEIIPGLSIWLTFFLALVLSFVVPLWVIYFIIVFDFYWLIRVVYVFVYLIIAYVRYRRDIRVNWLAACQKIPKWTGIYHLVVIASYKDEIEIIRTSLLYLTKISYPLDKLIVVLALEEREGAEAQAKARLIEGEFSGKFFKFFWALHPKDTPGEVAGKGSNIAYAGRQIKKWIDAARIPYENIAVSSFDVDSCVHPEYFSYLTYKYLTVANPTHTSFQPIPLFNNNIWDSPALMRVASNSTTFWLMSETLRPDRLFTFSSHSMSFKALIDVDFWQSDIVTEDSRIFIQGFIQYDGDYQVTPMYIPISMDTVLGKNNWESLKNLYKQQRRWAYGVENFPFMFWNFFPNSKIRVWPKLRYIWNQLEGVYSWATAPILIFVLGRLPVWVIRHFERPEIYNPVVSNTPNILNWLMGAAMIGLFISAILSLIILPPRPKKHTYLKYPLMALQWILFPISMIVFGSFPAIDAQTRLMLGKYLGFQTTKKVRKT
ncbi:MAG: glycosyltransferase family 2 protein [Patescibacteria group bacterium]